MFGRQAREPVRLDVADPGAGRRRTRTIAQFGMQLRVALHGLVDAGLELAGVLVDLLALLLLAAEEFQFAVRVVRVARLQLHRAFAELLRDLFGGLKEGKDDRTIRRKK